MKKGYDVFGKAYGMMMRNDLHALESIDHELIKEMVLLDDESYEHLYKTLPQKINMQNHELFSFAMQFNDTSDRNIVKNILHYCSEICSNYDKPFETMIFGGTEKEILDRGTDWCNDIARAGAVLLMCNGIPARIVHLANLKKAYNGHVVAEAFYDGKYGVCDFLYGYGFCGESPLDTYELMNNKHYLKKYPKCYKLLFSAAAISEYNPLGKNNYKTSTPNQYTLNLIKTNHHNKWIMGEDN